MVLRFDTPFDRHSLDGDTCLLNVGGDLMRGRCRMRFRRFRRCVVPLRVALDVKRQKTNDQAHDGNLTQQELAEIALREQADLTPHCTPPQAHQQLLQPPSPRGRAIPDLCLTPKILSQRPQVRLRKRASVAAL
jgi:hypothetical protein